MNRIYFPTSFFQDLHFKKLSVETRLVAVYLMTSPEVNLIGVYHVPILQMARQLQLDPYYIKTALQHLEQLNFCRYDILHEYIWICEFATWQDQIEPFPFKKYLASLGALSFLPEFYEFYGAYDRDEKIVKLPYKGLKAQKILDKFLAGKCWEDPEHDTY